MEFEEDLISVIIPVYNVEQYLPRCLDSVISNTYAHLEIICVNDGSTDNSKKILQDYAEREPRIILIDKQNGGVASARNKGLQYAKGEYIAYIDSDDWVHSSYFEHLHRAIKEFNTEIAVCDYVRTSDNDILRNNSEYRARLMSLEEMMSNHRTKSYVNRRLFRRTFISGIKFNENIQIEDAVYNAEILIEEIPKIVYVDEVLYAYFVRKGSLITQFTTGATLEVAQTLALDLGKVKEDRVKNIIYTEIVKRALSARYAFLILRDNEKVRECNTLMTKCFHDYHDIKLWLFYKFPGIHRSWIIMHDRTMLDYEKYLKVNRANNSK